MKRWNEESWWLVRTNPSDLMNGLLSFLTEQSKCFSVGEDESVSTLQETLVHEHNVDKMKVSFFKS